MRWPHAESVDVGGKLELRPRQSVAVLNPPPGLMLSDIVPAATDADAVVAFVVRRTIWAWPSRRWRRHARIAWHGSATPRAASSGPISTVTGLLWPWPTLACNPSAKCQSMRPGPRCGSGPRSNKAYATRMPLAPAL